MGFLGLDAVFRCDAKGCRATARIRVPEAWDGGNAHYLEILVLLVDEGFEADGDGLVCWNHGSGKMPAPDPAPALHGEKA